MITFFFKFTTEGMMVELVVPMNAILGVSAHFSVRGSSFIVLRCGHKIASLVKQKLGLEESSKSQFDPVAGGMYF